MSERFKELVLKTSDPARGRGFESHSLRQKEPQPNFVSVGDFFLFCRERGDKMSYMLPEGKHVTRGVEDVAPYKASCNNAKRCERIGGGR